MSCTFQFVAVPYETFAPLFDRTEDELRAIGVSRVVADEKPGFPCRVSLVDAEVGETVLHLTYTHHDVAGPDRASGPVYVRKGAVTARLPVGEIPKMLRHRLLSLRAFDARAALVNSMVVPGTDLEAAIERLLADASVAYLHVHNAAPGCFNCRVERSSPA